MKTINQVVNDIIDNQSVSFEEDSIEKIIAIAYYIGLEKGSRQVSNKYKAVLNEQRSRARKCRYYKMAMGIQGDVQYVYDENYDGIMTTIFGRDDTKLFDKGGQNNA